MHVGEPTVNRKVVEGRFAREIRCCDYWEEWDARGARELTEERLRASETDSTY